MANSHLRDITPSRVSSPDTPVESRLYVFPSPALPRTRHVLRLHIHTTAAEVLFFYSSGIRSPDLQIHSFQHQAPAATHVAILGHINCISTPQPHVFHDIASNLRRQHVLCYFLFFILSSALVSPQLGTLPSLLGSTMTTGFFSLFSACSEIFWCRTSQASLVIGGFDHNTCRIRVQTHKPVAVSTYQ